MHFVLSAIGLAALALLILLSSNAGTWYWGRRGPNKSWPFTRTQRRLICWSWGIALLLVSAMLVVRAKVPNFVSGTQWGHLCVFLVMSAMAITWIAGLIDARIKSVVASPGTARFVISVNWILATAMACIAIMNLLTFFDS